MGKGGLLLSEVSANFLETYFALELSVNVKNHKLPQRGVVSHHFVRPKEIRLHFIDVE